MPSVGARCGGPPSRLGPGAPATCPLAELLSPPADPEPPQGRAGPTPPLSWEMGMSSPRGGCGRCPKAQGPQPAHPIGGGSTHTHAQTHMHTRVQPPVRVQWAWPPGLPCPGGSKHYGPPEKKSQWENRVGHQLKQGRPLPRGCRPRRARGPGPRTLGCSASRARSASTPAPPPRDSRPFSLVVALRLVERSGSEARPSAGGAPAHWVRAAGLPALGPQPFSFSLPMAGGRS